MAQATGIVGIVYAEVALAKQEKNLTDQTRICNAWKPLQSLDNL